MKKITIKRPPSKRALIKKIRFKKVEINNKGLRKGIYIIPSLFTCGNLSLGIFSIMSSIEGNFIAAAWFLVGALACDILDGRIARMTNTTTDFGMQLDSLSDLASFGIAPAIMMYMLVLNTMEHIGIAIATFFVLCGALRLARFNALSKSGEIQKHFVGLPTPASAGVITSFVLSYQLLAPEEYALNFYAIPILMELMPKFFRAMPIVMVVLSLLMVSNIPYMSFKKLKLSKVRTIELLAIMIVLIILVVIFPQNTIFIIFSVYAVSGLLFYIPRTLLNKKRKKKEPTDENEV